MIDNIVGTQRTTPLFREVPMFEAAEGLEWAVAVEYVW
jgi:hypothetical protein